MTVNCEAATWTRAPGWYLSWETDKRSSITSPPVPIAERGTGGLHIDVESLLLQKKGEWALSITTLL